MRSPSTRNIKPKTVSASAIGKTDETQGERRPKAIRVSSIKDARRLLSRLISQLQQGTVLSRDAKDLTYLLSIYVQITRESDLEERLEALEKQTVRTSRGVR